MVRMILTTESQAMITSRLTAKAQTTIPKPIRDALRACAGDMLVYRIENGEVLLAKAAPTPAVQPSDNPFAVFHEWDSAADHDDYRDL